MQKPLALSIAACLGLAGCQVFQKSEAWKEAVSVRAGAAVHDPDPSHAYAAKLHSALSDKGIEHKVITYQYRYTTRLREEAVSTRTAVVYRDNTTGNYPWWLKDDRLNTPFWLPNGDLNKQVSFYIRRKAEVIESEQYPGQPGKATVAFARPVPALRPSTSRPEARVAAAKPALAPVRKAPTTLVADKPAPALTKAAVAKVSPPHEAPTSSIRKVLPAVARKPTVVAEPKKIAKTLEKRKPVPRPVVAQAPAAKVEKEQHQPGWNPPGLLDANQQSALTAPRDEHMETMFKRKHGTDYNRFSPIDRRKMQLLQQGLASRD